MSTWVECDDGSWVNLARVNALSICGVDDRYEVRIEASDGLFLHSHHDELADARRAVERILTAAGERCLRQGI